MISNWWTLLTRARITYVVLITQVIVHYDIILLECSYTHHDAWHWEKIINEDNIDIVNNLIIIKWMAISHRLDSISNSGNHGGYGDKHCHVYTKYQFSVSSSDCVSTAIIIWSCWKTCWKPITCVTCKHTFFIIDMCIIGCTSFHVSIASVSQKCPLLSVNWNRVEMSCAWQPLMAKMPGSCIRHYAKWILAIGFDLFKFKCSTRFSVEMKWHSIIDL